MTRFLGWQRPATFRMAQPTPADAARATGRLAVELRDDAGPVPAGGLAPAVVAAGLEAGWILNATGPSTLRLAPPLTVPVAELERFAAALPGLVASALTPAEGDRP